MLMWLLINFFMSLHINHIFETHYRYWEFYISMVQVDHILSLSLFFLLSLILYLFIFLCHSHFCSLSLLLFLSLFNFSLSVSICICNGIKISLQICYKGSRQSNGNYWSRPNQRWNQGLWGYEICWFKWGLLETLLHSQLLKTNPQSR